ncbi:DNA-binding transcriptional regulator [Polaromonas sp. P1(28)-13]|nr:DNA-binding transcriptional regulator [Polaromonas sp. P1(28)-13]
MASFPPVRAVERAIELLQSLNRQPISTLDQLHKQTGLPKPSLVRLLQTLVAKGLVNRAPQHGAYYLTSAVHTLSCGYHSEPRIIEAAAPVADALTAKFKWPVAVAVFDTDAVVVRYSTIPQSPLSLLHSSINMRLSLVSRALGRAYLAFCPPDEQKVILKLLAHSHEADDQMAHDLPAVMAMLEETHERGYALRSPVASSASNTLALPIYEDGHVVASLGLTWFSSALSTEEAIARLYPHLQAATLKITTRLGTLREPFNVSQTKLKKSPTKRPQRRPRGPKAAAKKHRTERA